MIKVVCTRDTKDYIGNIIYKGEVVRTSEYYTPYIENISIWAVQDSPNHIGYFRSTDFTTLNNWRKMIIDKILEND